MVLIQRVVLMWVMESWRPHEGTHMSIQIVARGWC